MGTGQPLYSAGGAILSLGYEITGKSAGSVPMCRADASICAAQEEIESMAAIRDKGGGAVARAAGSGPTATGSTDACDPLLAQCILL